MAKILVVEDEEILNDAYCMILKKQGHDVVSVYNGEEALAYMADQSPDLVLLDLRMPKMDGVNFLKALQAPKKHPKLKIIVFSNYDVEKEIDQAFELGATRYMLKSWASPKELVRIVNDTLTTSRTS